MNRKYTRKTYLDLIDKYKIARPDIQISSDFIVGFPGETDEDFAETLSLATEIKFVQSFSYKYSPRPGTPAALKEQIPENIKIARLAILQKQLMLNQTEFNKSCVDLIMPIFFIKDGRHDGQIIGKSPYMQSVYLTVDNKESLYGKIINVRITKALENSLTGVIH